MDSTARLPLQSPVPFPCHRDLRCNGDFLGEAAMQAEAVDYAVSPLSASSGLNHTTTYSLQWG